MRGFMPECAEHHAIHTVRVELVGQSESKPISLKAKDPAHRITTDLNIRNAPRSLRIDVLCLVFLDVEASLPCDCFATC